MDRPSRKTKVVNYCEAKDLDDDEDFASAKAPPSKRPREDAKQEHKRSLSKSSSQGSNSQTSSSQRNRIPLDERLHDRDLEAAIALSLLNNSDENKDQPPPDKGDVKVQIHVDENTDPTSFHLSNCSVDVGVLGLDEIISEKESLAPSRRKKAPPAEPRKKSSDEEDEYEPTISLDSDSDEDFSEPSESEDEEFRVKKTSKAKKEKVTKEKTKQPRPAAKKGKQPAKPSKSKPQAAATPTSVRSPPTVKMAPQRPASALVARPSVSVSPAGGRVPKWNPPGQVGKNSSSAQSPTGRSPGQGLRLGLSRLVRVKPLHPSVASH
ncbi:RAD51-associated protein 1 isoform X2 [Xyrichtys novacula]|nr:RAD51-associated protein 1 isoform X2 [Xyrichtys novacula]